MSAAFEPGRSLHGYAPSRIVPPMSCTCCWLSISDTTGFEHSGANSLEFESSSPHTSRANSMIAACIPRQMPKKGVPLSRAALIASTIPSTPRTPNPPGTSRPSNPAIIERAVASSVNRSLEVHAISIPTSFAMPPWMSASCTLL